MRYTSLSAQSAERLRADYIKEHAKFIHSSYCLSEDLDKEVTMNDGKTYRIAGLWDTLGTKKIILLQNVERGNFAYTDSKDVAQALGFTKFRNLVTGKEVTYDFAEDQRIKQILNKSKIAETAVATPENLDDEPVITPAEDIDAPVHERDSEYESDEDGNEEDNYVDPLVRSLQVDEDDSGWVDEDDNN